MVVDPCWDVDRYLEIARLQRLQITYVIDTHDHADHVSGRDRLARLTGARSLRAARAGDSREDAIAAGDEITIGVLQLRAIGTPGHRPEHLAFAVVDLSRGPEPWLVLTGDSLLVGGLARPDLVLEAAEGASELHSSIAELVALGDHVEVWPAHVGGSLCGGASLSRKTSSTIGFERRHNPLLAMELDRFVAHLTECIPPRPPNVERIVSLNCAGDAEPGMLPDLGVLAVADLLAAGVTVLDAREPEAFDLGHLAGAVNMPAGSAGVGTRAGWSFAVNEPILIVADTEETARTMAVALEAVGIWQAVGYVLGHGPAWERRGLPVATSDSWDLERLAGGLRHESVDLIDVRDASEWITGHVPGSHHLPLHRLCRLGSVDLPDHGRTTAVACAGGMRAAFAASLLRRAGRRDVVRVDGGGVGDLGSLGIELAVGD